MTLCLRCLCHAQSSHASKISHFYNQVTRAQATYQVHRIREMFDRTTELPYPSTALWCPTNLCNKLIGGATPLKHDIDI